jgi:MFS transporter, putative metabolite:H+ symporter
LAEELFRDAFDIYLQGAVLAALIGIGWSTPAQNANFLSATFAGMVIGAWRKRARPAFRETDPLRK